LLSPGLSIASQIDNAEAGGANVIYWLRMISTKSPQIL